MPERVLLLAAGFDQLLRDRLPQLLPELGVAAVGDGREQPVVHGAAGRGREPQELLGLVRTCLDPNQQHVAQRRWQLMRRNAHRAQVPARGDELLGEKGVAVGAGKDRFDRFRGRDLAEDALELRGDVVAIEALEVDALGAATALELGEERPQRMAPAQLVGAERRHDRHACGAELVDQVGEQVAGRPVGPVQIFDEEEDRSVDRQALEQPEHDLEETGRAAGSVTRPVAVRDIELGNEPPELGRGRPRVRADGAGTVDAHEGAQHLDHRPERRPGLAEIDAGAREHAPPVDARRELPEQPRLADSGFPAHHDGGGLPRRGARGRGPQPFEWGGPTDERGTRNPGCHRAHCRRPLARHATLSTRAPAVVAAGRITAGVGVSAIQCAARSSATAEVPVARASIRRSRPRRAVASSAAR